ncbi:beta-N-acetylhexosaminidase [Paenactinomyces guangxiensis]|uniref:beta-N-acetylhexosaminidase n=1 Tax=Paenactinomyces guangxiensis TaxID=1490290 RepID=UPI0018DB1D93|nr:beta-N-acetylhexosaminidase [Paenactinomyces guangxiensis]MBH8592013.1 beta-N-acetylhexosaminidase [Paenactinomyces guangxiensis]
MKKISVALICILLLGAVIAQPVEAEGKVFKAERLLKHMTLEEKVGQMVMGGFYGDVPSEDARRLIQEAHVGSIILFSYTGNVKDPLQTAKLTNGLQKMATETRLKLPLFIATDQEGGVVARLTTGATQLPGNMALGATRDRKLVQKAYKITAQELRAIGIQMNLAPDLDVNVNPANPVIGVRSFAEDPRLVAQMGTEAIRALQKNNVVATAKHFPGHGDTNVDSHLGLPVINKSKEELERVELVPFKQAVNSGIDAIMTAHINVPALDPTPDLPATLSKPILTGLLREKMGFNGLIITDSMTMAGVANSFGGIPQASVKAVEAGADIILLTPELTTDEQIEVYQEIVDAVRSGTLSEKRIDESVLRILKAKWKYDLYKDRFVDLRKVSKKVGTEKSAAQAQEIAMKSVTLVKNEGNLLPLKLSADQKLGIISQYPILDQVKAYHSNAEEIYMKSTNPTDAEIAQAVEMAKNKDVLVVGTYSASLYPQQIKLVKELQKLNKPIAVVAFRNPYDIKDFPQVNAYLNVYGFRPVSLKAAVDTLFGANQPTGKLPVTIPNLYPYGHGLSY